MPYPGMVINRKSTKAKTSLQKKNMGGICSCSDHHPELVPQATFLIINAV